MLALAPTTLPPRLTQDRLPLTHTVQAVNERGQHIELTIPAERDLTTYADQRELVTLMTLGEYPEWLVVGYLFNQRLVDSVENIESVTVDWDMSAAAAKTRHGIERLEERAAQRFWPPDGRHPPHQTARSGTTEPIGAVPNATQVLYTTGRLTSEMVIKAAQMGVAVVVSRSGITHMGLQVAQQVGLCAIGRATNRRFLCYSHAQRVVFDEPPVGLEQG